MNKPVNKSIDIHVHKDNNKPLGSNVINEKKSTDDPDEILASV